MTSLLKKAADYADMVKIAHTLFALPFAMSALCLAYGRGAQFDIYDILWVVLAFTAARSAAMGFNRIADEKFDAKNPRTKNRPICAGKISRKDAALFVGISCAVFVLAAAMLNFLCFLLSFPALAWLFFYSYTKRFTSAAHLVLGAAIAMSPLGAWIAVCGNLSWGIIFLSAAALFQICGFDLLYAIQDEQFDRENSLHSVPARFGKKKTRLFAAASFAASTLCLFACAAYFGGASLYAAAFIAAFIYITGLCVYAKGGVAKTELVFFKMNVLVSFEVLALNIINITF